MKLKGVIFVKTQRILEDSKVVVTTLYAVEQFQLTDNKGNTITLTKSDMKFLANYAEMILSFGYDGGNGK